jgi:hypothetical protein
MASEFLFVDSASPPKDSFFISALNEKFLIESSLKTLQGSVSTFFHLSGASASYSLEPRFVLIIE